MREVLLVPLMGGCLLSEEVHFLSAQQHVKRDLAAPLPIELPFEEHEGLLLVHGALDGAPVELVFDTGAPVTAVFDGSDDAVELPLTHPRRLGSADDPATPFGQFLLHRTLSLGALTLRDLPVVGIPRDTLPCREKFDAIGMNGAIGADLLRTMVVEVDFDAGVLRLYAPDRYTAPPDAVALPLTFSNGHILVPGSVGGPDDARAGLYHVDTGNNAGAQVRVGGSSGLAVPDAPTEHGGCEVSGVVSRWDGGTADVTLGTAVARGVHRDWAEDDHLLVDGQVGWLGILALRSLEPVFDYPHSTLWVRSPG